MSFVQAGELWNYNRDRDEVSLVFSFADAENTDTRNMLMQHDIKILNVDEKGNTTFAVCGYMNRGSHEGETGSAVYYYNIEQNSVEENYSYPVTRLMTVPRKKWADWSTIM